MMGIPKATVAGAVRVARGFGRAASRHDQRQLQGGFLGDRKRRVRTMVLNDGQLESNGPPFFACTQSILRTDLNGAPITGDPPRDRRVLISR